MSDYFVQPELGEITYRKPDKWQWKWKAPSTGWLGPSGSKWFHVILKDFLGWFLGFFFVMPIRGAIAKPGSAAAGDSLTPERLASMTLMDLMCFEQKGCFAAGRTPRWRISARRGALGASLGLIKPLTGTLHTPLTEIKGAIFPEQERRLARRYFKCKIWHVLSRVSLKWQSCFMLASRSVTDWWELR